MHTLEAAMAAALLNRRTKEGQADSGEIAREGIRGLCRLAVALAVIAAFAGAMEVASRFVTPEAPLAAIGRTR